MSYIDDINALNSYLSNGPSLGEDADKVVLLYKILSNLDRLDGIEDLNLTTQNINANLEILTTNSLINLEEGLLRALRNLPTTTTIYVSTGGDDANSGSRLSPVRTIGVAITKALAKNPSITNPVQIHLSTGVYETVCPIVLPRDISLIGDSYNSVIIKPTEATADNNILLVDSNSTIDNITFTGHRANRFAIAFNPAVNNVAFGATTLGAYVLKPCYIKDTVCLSSPNNIVIEGVTTDGSPAGNFIEVDGAKCAENSPAKMMILNNCTSTVLNGKSYLVKNSGQAHLYNCISNFADYHLRTETGGRAYLVGNSTNYGNYSLIADNYDPAVLSTAVAQGTIGYRTVDITAVSDTDGVYKGVLLRVSGNNYYVKSVTPITGGYTLTLDRDLISTLNLANVTFHKISRIFSTNHSMYNVGAGIDYSIATDDLALAKPENELLRIGEGIIIASTYNNQGDINLNNFFTLDSNTGNVNIQDISTINFTFNNDALQANLALDENINEIISNVTGTPDGRVPLPSTFNVANLSQEQIHELSVKLDSGSNYQLYVNIDSPNASDKKDNKGNSPLRPFRSLERALLEVSRRSLSGGANNDINNKVSIYIAPGTYELNNGPGGVVNSADYGRYQDAANLILLNLESIVEEAYQEYLFDLTDNVVLRSALRTELVKVLTYLADDLSSLGNKQIITLARSYVKPDSPTIGASGFEPAIFLQPFYYNLILDGADPVNNSLISGLLNGIFTIRDKAILAMRNLGAVTDPTITIDTDEPTCANVASTISTLTSILTGTLGLELDPRLVSLSVGSTIRDFPDNVEPDSSVLQAFNDPVNPGIVLPRGVSIIGSDLRKVLLKPKYVPDPYNNNANRSSIFRMTGGNFFSGFTVLDQSPQARGYQEAKSHHKLTAFAFCSLADLELYYNVVTVAFADRKIYNKSQDASNLLNKNKGWVTKKVKQILVDPNSTNYSKIFNRQLNYFIEALSYDLRNLDKDGITKFATRFKAAHIDTLEDFLKPVAITTYQTLINNSIPYIIQAINNLANTVEGGIIDKRIILDDSPLGTCSDVVSAIYNYLDIAKAIIGGTLIPDLLDDKFSQSDSEVIDIENSLVIPSNSSSVNTVAGASPYIFSASVRSEWGMCGVDGDGSIVTGLKSYLAAQFTIISIQRDTNVFTANYAQDEVIGLRYKGSRQTDFVDGVPDGRSFGYRVRNDAYAQLVSCFCICPAIHYWAQTGGEFSITNSTSNFGDISLYSEGYSQTPYPQDTDAQLIGIVKPLNIDYIATPDADFADVFTLGTIQTVDVLPNNQLRITLATAAKNLELYSIDNSNRVEGEPNRLSYVYVKGLNGDRRAEVLTHIINEENKSVITVDISDSPTEWITTSGNFVPTQEEINNGAVPEATVLAKALTIKRFVDTRKDEDREYRILIKRNVLPNGSLNGKRRPVIHYIIQKALTGNDVQPFTLGLTDVRTSFCVLDIKNTSTLALSDERAYSIQLGAINVNNLGDLEYDIDIALSTKLDLDYDPSDPLLADVLNSFNYSRENLETFLTSLGITGINLDITENRIIDLRSENISLDFHKPSIIRCGGQTWEYMGYYNYSSALPAYQGKKLGEDIVSDTARKSLMVSKTQTPKLGGRIYATGMDEEGNVYRGNTFEDLKTGKTQTIIRGSSPEVLNQLELEEIETSASFEDLTITGNLNIEGDIIGLPLATRTVIGATRIAEVDEVILGEDEFEYVTPFSLKKKIEQFDPQFEPNVSFTFVEGRPPGYLIGTLTPTIVNTNAPVNFTLPTSPLSPYFTINEMGDIRLTAAGSVSFVNNFLVPPNNFNLLVEVSNIFGTVTVNVAITVLEKLRINDQSFSYLENRSQGYVIGTLPVTGNPEDYVIINGNDDGYFELTDAGVLKLTPLGVNSAANDYDVAPNMFQLTVLVFNDISAAAATITVYVTDIVDTPPLVPNGQAFAYNENQLAGYIVGTLSASNSPTAFAFTSGNEAGFFAISNSGVITLTSTGAAGAANNFEVLPNIITLGFSATNSFGTTTNTCIITVVDVFELLAPTIPTGQTFSYPENRLTGYTIGTVNNTGGVATTFTITAGNESGFFAIDNDGVITLTSAGVAGAANDFEILPNSFTLTVAATNAAGSSSATVGVSVTNISELALPNIGAQTFNYNENRSIGYVIGTVNNTGGVIDTYAITAGNDSGFFAISNSGVITLTSTGAAGAANDFEISPNQFNLTVTATNYTGTDTAAITINVTDVAELLPPVVASGQSFSYFENRGSGFQIGTVINTGGAATSFSITSGNGSGFFSINNSGVISLTSTGLSGAANDAETSPNTFNITIQASNAAGNSTQTVTLNVLNDPAETYQLEITYAGSGGFYQSTFYFNVSGGTTNATAGLIIGTVRIKNQFGVILSNSIISSYALEPHGGIYPLPGHVHDSGDESDGYLAFNIDANGSVTLNSTGVSFINQDLPGNSGTQYEAKIRVTTIDGWTSTTSLGISANSL